MVSRRNRSSTSRDAVLLRATEGDRKVCRRAHRPRLSAAILGAVVFLACADATGPSAEVTPELSVVAFDDLRTILGHGGLLWVLAFPADSSFRLARDRRVPVEVEVSSGDRETAYLYRNLCPARDGALRVYSCFNFGILMKDGHHAADVADQVAAIGGRFNLISASGWLASVTVFTPEKEVRLAERARSWPGVERTSLSSPACLPGVPRCRPDLRLTVPLPVDTGAAVPGDGIVQLRSGDTVTVRYLQPHGGTVGEWVRVP